ncbi:hypothetical protein L0V05_10100 [Tabrizicola sp. J26]|uniref:hypothetical protein n=1 Tax=Alitabrizicola rongguiensis TaxID=2909234 RepID=UPI001F317C5F|nr:hypothetical protein [Tabrizicola rongguiensis]MCF1709168.1 hypothetical protein [Tabrizicola rongguiensis]
MRRLAAGLICLVLVPPASAEETPRTAEWVVQESWAGGHIGTNPRNLEGILFRMEDGTMLPVIWDEAAGPKEVLKGCDFFIGGGGHPCRAILRAGAVRDGKRLVMIVYRVQSIEPPAWIRE